MIELLPHTSKTLLFISVRNTRSTPNRDPLGKDPILDQPDTPVLGVLIKFLWHTPDFPIYSNGRKPGPFHSRQ